MPQRGKIEQFSRKAVALEKKYDWAKAADHYERALGAVRKKDLLRKAEIQEKIGRCFHRAAFQAETREEFEKYMGLSVESYEEAARLFETLEDSKEQARVDFCKAMASYSKSWLAKDSSERKALLDDCWKLEKTALKVYEETGDRLGYGKTCNELLTCLYDRHWFAWNWQELKKMYEEGIRYGEKAIEAPSDIKDENELARAYARLSLHYYYAEEIYESMEKKTEMYQKSLAYAQKALAVSEKTGDFYLLGLSSYAAGYIVHAMKGDIESSLRYAEKQLEMGTKIDDSFMIAEACCLLAYLARFKTSMEEDPDKRRKEHNKIVKYAEKAITRFELLSYPFTWSYYYRISGYAGLARDETNLEEKRALLKKAIEVGRKYLEQAKRLNSPHNLVPVLYSVSEVLYALALTEMRTGEKRSLLEEAIEYRKEGIHLYEQLFPFSYWNRGALTAHLALTTGELAKIETDNQRREDLIRTAVLSMEDCLRLCRIKVKASPHPDLLGSLGHYQDRFGGMLNQLYLLTSEKRHLGRAIKTYEDAGQTWKKCDLQSRVAETHWKMAKLYDHLGEHSKAAREFESASERYKLAIEKMPQLKAFYTDFADYMQAWSEIEEARYNHAEKQYGQAKEHYEKATNLHRSIKQWEYLSSNYLAWARLEEAEDLSRKEQTEEARDLFQQAANLFVESKRSVKTKREKIEAKEEQEMAAELVRASDIRREYCLGRIALEEAKILDREGDHATSSRRYGSSAEKIEKAISMMEHELDRQELRPIVHLCKAWQMMTRAEAEVSPNLYLKASKLFDKAKKHSFDEKAKTLAVGHSSFCKALEAGTRFEGTRSMTLYSTAKKHLEAAASYYAKAGFKTASEYTKATRHLFDAYMYTHKAETETEAGKKARYYQMVERLLQASADSYMKAKHPKKGEDVDRLLESAKEERRLAMSLAKVLHAPTITSTTASFSTPTPTREQAVGLERFEHANIQANLILRAREVMVGENIDLEIELVNAGRAPALLIKVEEIIPEDFEVKEVPEVYRIEDRYLNMKGRRLDPLKTEEVRLALRPRTKGTFPLKPRILYVDETGAYKSHEPEPTTITVKELGIRGWIKGGK